jgi:medium-chain acyl-[acyl-carrier-protein] hydrolase
MQPECYFDGFGPRPLILTRIHMSHGTRGASKPIWLSGFNSRTDASIRLLCFPYAGGDATTIFRKWPEILPRAVEVCAVQLPGRGMRISEPPFSDIRSAAETLSVGLRPYLNKPFAFFGHSLGARICFEVARLLKATEGIQPFHLFVSGASGPRVAQADAFTHDLPEPEFLAELRKLNGTPPEVLGNAELMKLMMPVLRAEIKACQTYIYTDGPPLDCPITAFGGLQDVRITREKLQAWREETSRTFSLHLVPGDHFFINTQPALILRVLAAHVMTSFLNRSSLTNRIENRA